MIAIYGVNGFLGRHLLSRLIRNGDQVKGFSRNIPRELNDTYSKLVELSDVNLNEPMAVGASLAGVDTVVQLISTSSPGMRNSYIISDIEQNVIPHVQFIQSAIEAGVKRFIFLSSGGTVYGPAKELPIHEDQHTNPINSHGLTKLTIEKYLQMYGVVDDLDYVILRLSNPYGPGQTFKKGQGLIPAVLERHRQNLPVRIIGGGTAQRDFIYIDDVIDAIVAATKSQNAAKKIINIGSGEARSVLDVINAMEEILGESFLREIVDARSTDVDINKLDISRAAQLLDWKPKTQFMDGLRQTLES